MRIPSKSKPVLAGILSAVAFISCQDNPSVVYEDDPNAGTGTKLAVAFSARDSATIPDSIAWTTPLVVGHSGLRCVSSACQDSVYLNAPLGGSDTLIAQTWTLGIRTSTRRFPPTSTNAVMTREDSLAGRILVEFAGLATAKADSFKAVGGPKPADILVFTAKLVVSGSPVLDGYAGVLPKGINLDSLRKIVVVQAVKQGLPVSQVVALKIGIDTASLRKILGALVSTQILSTTDTLAFLAKPVPAVPRDSALSVLATRPGKLDRTFVWNTTTYNDSVPWGTTMVTVDVQARTASDIRSIRIQDTTNPDVVLSGSDPTVIVVKATNLNGNSLPYTLNVYHQADTAKSHPFLPPEGTYIAAQWVKLRFGAIGSALQYSTDNKSWTDYADSILVAVSETLYVQSVESGRVTGSIRAEYTVQNVSKPLLTPKPGPYSTAQDVAISCLTPGVALEYSTNGIQWSTYATPIHIAATQKLYARASRVGMSPKTDSGTYSITATVDTPTFSPGSGRYAASQNVALATATPDAEIRFTVDGTDPTPNSTLYSNAVAVTGNQTIRAIAIKAGLTTSGIASADYRFDTAKVPALLPSPGTYPTAQWVKLRDPAPSGTRIEVSTTGASWSDFKDSILVAVPETLQFQATQSGFVPTTTQAIYSIQNVASPKFSPDSGFYVTAQNVSITTTTPGASLQYSVNGGAWQDYALPIATSSTSWIRARASRTGMTTSVDSARYEISPLVSVPVFSPAPGSFTASQNITLSCANSLATIEYSTDSLKWTEYKTGSPVHIDTSTRLIARASLSRWTTSFASGTYSITTASPRIALSSGTYVGAQSTAITGPAGAAIFYSTDSVVWKPYTGPVPLTGSGKLHAFDSLPRISRSAVTSANYRLQAAPPQFSLAEGRFVGERSLTISDTMVGATLFYGLDTNTWVQFDPQSPIPIKASVKIYAKATAPGMDPTVRSASYTIVTPAPTNKLASGIYSALQMDTLVPGIPGATIVYTTDSLTWHTYIGPFQIQTSRVFAYDSLPGMAPSDTIKTRYTYQSITGISPASGTYNDEITVAITSSIPGTIEYMLGSGVTYQAYTGPFKLSSSATVNARIRPGSGGQALYPVASYLLKAAKPAFSIAGGAYPPGQTVTISVATPGASVYYTLDSTAPTTASTLYDGKPIAIGNAVLRAIATKGSLLASEETMAKYAIATAASPTITPGTGTYSAVQAVSLATTTTGATIYYTTDGTTPTSSSLVFKAGTPIPVSGTQTIKAFATAPGMAASPVAWATYTWIDTLKTVWDFPTKAADSTAARIAYGALFYSDSQTTTKVGIDSGVLHLDGIWGKSSGYASFMMVSIPTNNWKYSDYSKVAAITFQYRTSAEVTNATFGLYSDKYPGGSLGVVRIYDLKSSTTWKTVTIDPSIDLIWASWMVSGYKSYTTSTWTDVAAAIQSMQFSLNPTNDGKGVPDVASSFLELRNIKITLK